MTFKSPRYRSLLLLPMRSSMPPKESQITQISVFLSRSTVSSSQHLQSTMLASTILCWQRTLRSCLCLSIAVISLLRTCRLYLMDIGSLGSLVCSRFLQYVYIASFLFQGLTWLKDKNARVGGATWMHLLGYRSTLAVLHGFKSLQNTDA